MSTMREAAQQLVATGAWFIIQCDECDFVCAGPGMGEYAAHSATHQMWTEFKRPVGLT